MGIDTASELFRSTDEMLNEAFTRKKSSFISDTEFCGILEKASATLSNNLDHFCQHRNPKMSSFMKDELKRTISIINELRIKTN